MKTLPSSVRFWNGPVPRAEGLNPGARKSVMLAASARLTAAAGQVQGPLASGISSRIATPANPARRKATWTPVRAHDLIAAPAVEKSVAAAMSPHACFVDVFKAPGSRP